MRSAENEKSYLVCGQKDLEEEINQKKIQNFKE